MEKKENYLNKSNLSSPNIFQNEEEQEIHQNHQLHLQQNQIPSFKALSELLKKISDSDLIKLMNNNQHFKNSLLDVSHFYFLELEKLKREDL